MHYFIRANGETEHNNPGDQAGYVPGEPPTYPVTKFDYARYCAKNDIARIGWPDTGDLLQGGKAGALATKYDLDSLEPEERAELETFRDISIGETVLMPKDASGLYIGEVNATYSYHHDIPWAPYECAHRIGVAWDRNERGEPRTYWTSKLQIRPQTGLWRRSFQVLERTAKGEELIERIRSERGSPPG